MIDHQILPDNGLPGHPLTLTHSILRMDTFHIVYANANTYHAYHSGRDKPSRAA